MSEQRKYLITTAIAFGVLVVAVLALFKIQPATTSIANTTGNVAIGNISTRQDANASINSTGPGATNVDVNNGNMTINSGGR